MARIVIDTGEVRIDDGYAATLPAMTPVRQSFDDEAVPADAIGATVAAEFERRRGELALRPGDRVAVGVGSRGIAHLAELVKALVAELTALKCQPFVVPAMGSHGGATASGQERLLASYGITEELVGAPVRSSMETVLLGEVDGVEVHVDRIAHEQADAVMTVSRIKPHTSFRGPIESGIHKMLAVGLGKHAGAATLHRGGMREFPELIPKIGAYVMDRTAYAGSLAVVENAHHGLARVELVLRDDLPAREAELLDVAKRLMPRLLLDEIDVLVVDEVGKDVSGGGMDTNVIGRAPGNLITFERPRINKIVVLGLTAATHGHPGAIALADYITAQVAADIDFAALYTNSITDAEPGGAKLPVILDDARTAVAVAMQTAHQRHPEDVRVVRITNTLDIDRILVSPNLLDQVARHPSLHVCGPPTPWPSE